jgi:hypothetical protein
MTQARNLCQKETPWDKSSFKDKPTKEMEQMTVVSLAGQLNTTKLQ